ncbi:MAG: GNAT family N-acetyltransferase [Halanaerobiales bacterium]
MKVIDLNEKYESLYFVCLEEWSEEMKEAGNHKRNWYHKIKDKGLGVKLSLDDHGEVGGMIQYVPIEYSPAEGRDLYFIKCIWVHGHKKGRGNFQKKGMGKALLQAAEEDVKARGAKGMVAWGMFLPFWMKASWFKKQGYIKTDRDGMQVLLWKPFADNIDPPKWIKNVKKPQAGMNPGKITVTAFNNGFCPAQNAVLERAKRAASEIGDRVIFQQINTFDRDIFLEWGISDALFIEDKEVSAGPPPSYKKIMKLLKKECNKISSIN